MPPKASKRKAANGYRLPDPIPAGEIVTGLTKKKSWRVGKSIGVGGFGEIYLCSEDVSRNVGEDATLAMKIEPHENGPLFVEMNFYIRAAQPNTVADFKQKKGLTSLGMPVHCGSGSHTLNGDKYRFLVMERFGKDLQKIFQTGKRKFPAKAAYTIAIKVIDTLEYIHAQGYVHNDIKAQNLLLGHGRTKENDVYLVDFGLVSKYQRDGVHLEYKPDARKAHDGTIEYTSRDAHIGAHSRRSDLEILGYNLVHWMSGTLPWMDNLTNPQYVHMQKQGFMNEVPAFLHRCFGDTDYPSVLEEFLEYTKGLEFDTAPDYDKCRDMFKKAMKKLKTPYDGKLDFSMPKSPAKKVGSSPAAAAKKAVTPGGERKGTKRSVSSKKSAKKTTEDFMTDDDEAEEEQSKAKKASPQKRKRSKVKPAIVEESEEEEEEKPKKASPQKRKRSKVKPAIVEESEEEEQPVKASPQKRERSKAIRAIVEESDESEEEVKKTAKAVKKLKVEDKGCQTSPGFVRQARAAKKASKANNPEMEEFVSKAMKAAVDASAGKRKSPRSSAVASTSSSPETARPVARKTSKKAAKVAEDLEEENNLSAANPTPLMLAMMKKRQESAVKKKTSKR